MVVLIAMEIEKSIKKLIVSYGLAGEDSKVPLRASLNALVKQGYIPTKVLRLMSDFSEVRNSVVHGDLNVSNLDLARVLDIGISLLRIINTLPKKPTKVVESDIPLYVDLGANYPLEGVMGVKLRYYKDDQEPVELIFPTTKLDYYKPDNLVSWEWDLTKVWGPAYYRSSGSGLVTKAWEGSSTFIGTHIN